MTNINIVFGNVIENLTIKIGNYPVSKEEMAEYKKWLESLKS